MRHSPLREANNSSASQEIPRILWNPNVHPLNHNSPPTVYNQYQTKPLYSQCHTGYQKGSEGWRYICSAIHKEARKVTCVFVCLCVCMCVSVCQSSLNYAGTVRVPPGVGTHHLQMSAAATETLTSLERLFVQTVSCQSGCIMHC